MLTQCPSLLSCGALYPVWLNGKINFQYNNVKMQFCDSQTKPVISYFYILSEGSLPSLSDGIVNRKACKVGFESCCTRSYDIQIKHCGSFYAYCLAALDTCPERYCFGSNKRIVLIMIRKSTLKPTFVKLNF